MLKTIKVKKYMRLDELIKYIFDGGIEDKVFPSNGGSSFDMCEVRISGSGNIKTSGYINEHTTFTVEVEEPITEDTVFKTLVDVNNNDEVHIAWNASISLYDREQIKEIHAVINGKLQLIWGLVVMSEELGYEVTPKQSLDGLWETMHKYIDHHGYSDISLEIEGAQYEFRQHLQKYDEYEAKAKAFDYIMGKKNEVEDDIYKFAVVREESAYQYLGYEVFKFIDDYESGDE